FYPSVCLPASETASIVTDRAARARTLAIFVVVASTVCGCSYRPARFVDRPPVTEVKDDAPVPVPRRWSTIEPLVMAELYVWRPLGSALDTERYPDARDVNAMDEVPRSSWFSPGDAHLGDARAGASVGADAGADQAREAEELYDPPEPPLT